MSLLRINRLLPLTGYYQLTTPETSGRLSTSVRRSDIWDRLGNFRQLKLANSWLGNHGPITTHASAQSHLSFWSGQLESFKVLSSSDFSNKKYINKNISMQEIKDTLNNL